MFTLRLELKRVQTFIFEVPRLKAMLGANAVIGDTLRHELTRLLGDRGVPLEWPAGLALGTIDDPLNQRLSPGDDDRDDPPALYKRGILARDGGHFNAVFANEDAAAEFVREAEELLGARLPGVLYETNLARRAGPRESDILDLPVLQVCQETGAGLASHHASLHGQQRWFAGSVNDRLSWGDKFYAGGTKDIIGLMRPVLYPDKARGWKDPDDLAQLAAGDYLALIHADGNGIGRRYNAWRAKYQGLPELAQEAHGEVFFHSMRVAVRRALTTALTETFTESGGKRPYEVLMLGGDDLLLLCRADKALAFAERYCQELEGIELADGAPLHVAMGVAIAKKSYPLHRLHELAESLASSAKRLYRALGDDAKASVIDWQVVTQSWFEGVAEVRRSAERVTYLAGGKPQDLLLTMRPYPVRGAGGLEGLLAASDRLKAMGDAEVPRSALRALRAACEQGRLNAELAFERLSKPIRSLLEWRDGGLWRALTTADNGPCATRALDIVGIWEIARLGSKKHD